MISPVLLAELDPQVMGWIFLLMGLGALGWAAFDFAAGETRVGDSSGFNSHVVRQDEQPTRFHGAILVTIFAGLVCFAAAAYLLV